MRRKMRWLGLMLARSFGSSSTGTVPAQAPDGQPRRGEVLLCVGSAASVVHALEVPF